MAESPFQSTDKGSLIRWMVGRDLSEEYPASRRRQNREILRLEHVSSGMLHDVSLRVYSGEILGIAGLAGAGRTELARVIFGADRLEAGSMSLHGKEYKALSPQDAISGGIGFLPEDRNRFGLILQMDVRRNVSLANLKGVMKAGFLHVRLVQFGERVLMECGRGFAAQDIEKLQAITKGYELALNEIFKAYPEDIMPDTTQDDRDPIIKQYPGFIDRTSAMMGRHIAKVIRETAAHFANEILEEERHDDEPEWVCEICGSDYLEHQVGHYDHLYKGPLK